MARLKSKCKAVTGRETRGTAERFGETMVETLAETSVKRETAVGYDVVTQAKVRMEADGSGLFELYRDGREIVIRWNPEKDGPLVIQRSGEAPR